MTISRRQAQTFQRELAEFYVRHGRSHLPWRHTNDPYRIFVSELMLQQTQVSRVIPKYEEFLQRFPGFEVLAASELGDVLRAWQGLGYNRRAKYLWQAAQRVVQDYAGQLPSSIDQLVKLPGIGPNTAGAIVAYAFNQPVVFIETNIRTVYFHHFFKDKTAVADKELVSLVEDTLDRENPREFYWALMDYGSWLKSQGHGPVTQSKHYVRQSSFTGSKRQLRGLILRSLSDRPYTELELLELVQDERSADVLYDLVREGMVVRDTGRIRLA